jgi:hypothetical protein
MATYTFSVSRCAGGDHVHLVATESGGEVLPIGLLWDEVRDLLRAPKEDYRQYADPIADILIELRRLMRQANVTTFAQARTVINNASVTV